MLHIKRGGAAEYSPLYVCRFVHQITLYMLFNIYTEQTTPMQYLARHGHKKLLIYTRSISKHTYIMLIAFKLAKQQYKTMKANVS